MAKQVKSIEFLSLPSAKIQNLPLSSITFDRRLQHRAKLTDETTVTEYAERDKEAADAGAPSPLPPIKAIFEKGKAAKGDAPAVPDRYWCYNGFQRGAAWEANGREEVQCEVRPGTFADAYFLSLSANSDDSILPRTKDDARRSVWSLIDNDDALSVCQKLAAKNGGLTLVMAKACGVSVGTVQNALKDRGKMVRGDSIINRPKSEDEAPAPKPDAAIGAPVAAAPVAPAAPVDEAAKQKANDAAYAVMKAALFADRVAECAKLTKRIGAIMSTLITDSERGAMTRDLMAKAGLSVSGDFDVRAKSDGKDFQPYYEILELWPVTQKLGAFFLDLKKAHDLAQNPPAPTPEPDQAAPAEAPKSEDKPEEKTPKKGGKKKPEAPAAPSANGAVDENGFPKSYTDPANPSPEEQEAAGQGEPGGTEDAQSNGKKKGGKKPKAKTA